MKKIVKVLFFVEMFLFLVAGATFLGACAPAPVVEEIHPSLDPMDTKMVEIIAKAEFPESLEFLQQTATGYDAKLAFIINRTYVLEELRVIDVLQGKALEWYEDVVLPVQVLVLKETDEFNLEDEKTYYYAYWVSHNPKISLYEMGTFEGKNYAMNIQMDVSHQCRVYEEYFSFMEYRKYSLNSFEYEVKIGFNQNEDGSWNVPAAVFTEKEVE